MQEIHSKILAKPSINPAAAITGNGVTTGATIDSTGYEHLEFVLQSGVITDGAFAGAVYGGNQANMSDEVQLTVDGGAHPGLISADVSFAASDDNVVKRQGVNVGKAGFQYYRQKATQSGATSGGFLSGTAILANPKVMPTSSP
jgi:hypothetical protein